MKRDPLLVFAVILGIVTLCSLAFMVTAWGVTL